MKHHCHSLHFRWLQLHFFMTNWNRPEMWSLHTAHCWLSMTVHSQISWNELCMQCSCAACRTKTLGFIELQISTTNLVFSQCLHLFAHKHALVSQLKQKGHRHAGFAIPLVGSSKKQTHLICSQVNESYLMLPSKAAAKMPNQLKYPVKTCV